MTYKELFELCRRIMGDALGRDFNIEMERSIECTLDEPFEEMRVRISYSCANVANIDTHIDTFEVRFLEDEEDDDGDIGFLITRYGGYRGKNGFASEFPFEGAPDELYFLRDDDGSMVAAWSDYFDERNTVKNSLEIDFVINWIMYQKIRLA